MDIIYLLWLTLKDKISYMKKHRLLKHFNGAKGVYDACAEEYSALGFLTEKDVSLLSDKSLKQACDEMEGSKKLGIWLLDQDSPHYPPSLLNIPDTPFILYGKGDMEVLQNRAAVCIVGTRNSTVYGMSSALAIAERLASAGMVVVSGVAMGIDSAAHRGAVKGGGKTIGVMGCGLQVDYPKGNRKIRELIEENGALISEFPLKTPPFASNFPQRNRILSGLSLGVAVIEAGEKSGALITAGYAAEQGKDVFALPGNISSPKSGGTNRLIQDGAILLYSPDEIIEEYLYRYPELFVRKESPKEYAEPEAKVAEKAAPAAGNITDDERIVLNTVGSSTLHIDEICAMSGLDISRVNALLTMLSIKGRVVEHPGRYYSSK